MTSILNQLQGIITLIQNNLILPLLILSIFWISYFINVLSNYQLNRLGIKPRSITGLIGIIFSPFLHGSFNHLFFNSIPLFIFVDFILSKGMNNFVCVSVVIILLGGFATWLFARRAIHIGASGLIMGYLAYVLMDAYQHPSIATILIAIICIYYFGGLLLSILPKEEKVSWEGHLFGFLAGLVAVYIYPYIDITLFS